MSAIENQEVFNYLKTIGCCNTCCLRYFNGRGDDYLNIDKSLLSRSIRVSHKDADTGELHTENGHSEAVKKFKENVCIACLGLFSESIMTDTLSQIVDHPDVQAYQCDTVLSSFSLPILLNLRQLSIWVGLIRKFPNRFSLVEPPDVPLKEIVKQLINPSICTKLNKTFEQNQNGLMINVFFEHENESAEMQTLFNVNPTLFKERIKAPRKFHREFMTRNAFEKHFIPSKFDLDTFCENVNVPGSIPNNGIRLDKITVVGPTIFVAGRYRKFSRELCQSPWILQGKRVMEECVSEIIINEIGPYFNLDVKNITFSSSGREDVDVRCLGKGRPFALEIPDAHITILPQSIAGAMEINVDKSEKVSIQHLQIISREDLKYIKQGEDSKRKHYRALCALNTDATVELLQKLNIPDGFVIEQLTPIRVLHRRPLLARPRQIYSVQGYVDKDNLQTIILDIVTQAGTYVKELVHGEFGRTNPSISSIIGQWIDIVALDVVAIDIDWPLEIDNKCIE